MTIHCVLNPQKPGCTLQLPLPAIGSEARLDGTCAIPPKGSPCFPVCKTTIDRRLAADRSSLERIFTLVDGGNGDFPYSDVVICQEADRRAPGLTKYKSVLLLQTYVGMVREKAAAESNSTALIAGGEPGG